MPVHDLGLELERAPCDMRDRGNIPHADLAAHRHARQAERQRAGKLRQHSFGARAAASRIGDDPHTVAAPGLGAGEVDDVTKQPAHWGAQNMQDVEGAVRRHLAFTLW